MDTGTHQGYGGLRHSRWDAWLVALALALGVLFVTAPTIPLIAVGLWWNANTISHHFIHLPFFRARPMNALFSGYLSLLLGIPQTLWRQRHLAHHADVKWRWRWTHALAIELALVLGLWGLLLGFVPAFFLIVYLPGWLLGLGLCQLQGHFEHARGATSHYGRVYNLVFFNDGYHAEHHAVPGVHWKRLPARKIAGANQSHWPAVFRWLEILSLDALERLVLRSPRLQQFMLKNHERAFRQLLSQRQPVRKAGIVGGGLFPRTALVLQRVLPEARLRIIDADARNLHQAQAFLNGPVEFCHEFFDASKPNGQVDDLDLLVIPLAFIGDRAGMYEPQPARRVLIHDWLWRRSKTSVVISWPLLKRLNLVEACAP